MQGVCDDQAPSEPLGPWETHKLGQKQPIREGGTPVHTLTVNPAPVKAAPASVVALLHSWGLKEVKGLCGLSPPFLQLILQELCSLKKLLH